MAKIMIVEDDRNLQSIYGDRLKAEGHTIITASDGEEALAVAVKEKPDLIISDIMMPKISGFDMLDILRTTPETRNVKIVMMTALSQAEDRERADKLGADKYLVKSQVTLDDVARTVNEIVSKSATSSTPSAPSEPTPVPSVPVSSAITPEPATDNSKVVDDPQAVVDNAATIDDEQAKISSQIDDFLKKNVPDSPAPKSQIPVTSDKPNEDPLTIPPPAVSDQTVRKTIEPDPVKPKSSIFELYEQELAKEAEAGAKEPTEPPKT